MIGSLDDPLAQIMASHDSDLPSYGNTASLPPIRSQRPTMQTLSTGNDFAERRRGECILSGMPVEPELILGFHGRPFRPLENVSLESGTHSTPPSFAFNQSIKSGPDRDVLISQSSSTVPSMVPLSLNSSVASQPPPQTLVTVVQEPLYTQRRESWMESAASTIIMADQAPASFEPFGCTYPLSALPFQQAPAKCAMLTALASWQDVDTAEEATGVKTLLDEERKEGSYEDTSDWAGIVPRAATGPESDDFTYLAGFGYEGGLPNVCTTSQERGKGHRVEHSSRRRSSVSVRFAPYKRRRSKAADTMEQGPKGAVDEGRPESSEMHGDVGAEEDEVLGDCRR